MHMASKKLRSVVCICMLMCPSYMYSQHGIRHLEVQDILARNGSAMDAAVAALFCNGIVNCQSMGLGGGFLMTIYKRDQRRAITLNARESAPANANEAMYSSNLELARKGPLAVAVPGELQGYWEAHKKYGRLPWSDVIAPSIKICRDGYRMTKHQDDSLRGNLNHVLKDPILRDVFVNHRNELFRVGSLIKNTKLCDTLEQIAKHGGDIMYRGPMAKDLVKDIQSLGGVITEQDMADYKVKWEEPIHSELPGGKTIYSIPPPGSGALLVFVLNILSEFHFTGAAVSSINSTITTYHRIIEAFKYAMAIRSQLGDSDYVNNTESLHDLTSKEYASKVFREINAQPNTSNSPAHYGAVSVSNDDHGTAHISVLAQNGDAVSVTSSVNLYFGAGITSESTGIILNSGMADFTFPNVDNNIDLPPSESNRMAPGKRSFSSMTPTIIVDKNGDVRLVLGASGSKKILTATALVIIRHFWFGDSIKQAVDAPRFHHQLHPMKVTYEYGILKQVIDGLQSLGHQTQRYKERGSIICAIAKLGKLIMANADFRKGGEVYGL